MSDIDQPPIKAKKTKPPIVEEIDKAIAGAEAISKKTKAAEAIPVVKAVQSAPTVNISKLQTRVAKLLKFSTFEPPQRFWLDTGDPKLNATLGSETKGLAYGKLMELFGPEHGGKTGTATILAGMAQRDGAGIGYIDLEDSRDPVWATKLGLNWDQVYAIYPKLVYKKDDMATIPVLQSAEALFAETEAMMAIFKQQGFEKQFWILDSVANIQTEMNVEAGLTDQSMRTRLDRAVLLSTLLPRWAGLAAGYNAIILLINQLRDKPGVMYGDPTATPGGRALKHGCSIRAKVRRIKNGRLKNGKKTIGICGIIQNVKNKAGEGSCEGESCGFRIRWDKDPAEVTFLTEKEVTAALGEGDE